MIMEKKSLSDKITEVVAVPMPKIEYNYDTMKVEDVREAVKELKKKTIGLNEIIDDIFGEKLSK